MDDRGGELHLILAKVLYKKKNKVVYMSSMCFVASLALPCFCSAAALAAGAAESSSSSTSQPQSIVFFS